MMNADLIIFINELNAVNQKQSSNTYVTNFEYAIAEIHSLRDSDSIPLLIDFFKDDCEYDELMFSIIHTIEEFDDKTYVAKVLKKLEDFFKNSPHWAYVVHIRILNSKSTLDAYIEEVKSSTEKEQIETLRTLLTEIKAKEPELKKKVGLLLDATN